MIDGARRTTSLSRFGPPQAWPVLCAGALLIYFIATLIGRQWAGGVTVEDDAFYYLVIARNIAASGDSTFDHQSLTNGYHPLWLALLVLQDLTVGPSLMVTLTIQAVLLAGGAYLLLRGRPEIPPLLQVAFAGAYALVIGHFGLDGMETALLMFCIGLFVAALRWAQAGGARRNLILGLAAAACVGARIDSAFFILPALALAPLSRTARAQALAVVAGLGIVYAAGNLAVFGSAMPVSSTVKSLGGLQINHPLLAQLRSALNPRYHSAYYLLTVLLLAISPAFIPLTRPGSLERTLAQTTSIGGAIYLVKLFFLSSWVIWPWYNFVILFPMLTGLYGLAPAVVAAEAWLSARFGEDRGRAAVSAASVVGLAGILLFAAAAAAWPPRRHNEFASINHLAIQRYGAILRGAPVAMGDRAGSFAMEYPGPVVQLEGLVNDTAYLQALKGGGDLRGLLCRRGVRYLVAYRGDDGDYQHDRIEVLRSFLTQFKGPMLDVWRADEVGRVKDQQLFDSRLDGGAGDNTLVIWKLRCDGAAGR